MSPPKATRIIMCCVRLHNFVIDVDGAEAAKSVINKSQEHKYFSFPQDTLWDKNEGGDKVTSSSFEDSVGYGKDLRNHYVSQMENLGIVRPSQ